MRQRRLGQSSRIVRMAGVSEVGSTWTVPVNDDCEAGGDGRVEIHSAPACSKQRRALTTSSRAAMTSRTHWLTDWLLTFADGSSILGVACTCLCFAARLAGTNTAVLMPRVSPGGTMMVVRLRRLPDSTANHAPWSARLAPATKPNPAGPLFRRFIAALCLSLVTLCGVTSTLVAEW